MALHAKLREHTLLDEIRLYMLWALGRQVYNGDALEVGVWRGGSGAMIAKATNATTFLCDTFAGVVKASDADPYYQGGEHADATKGDVEALLRSVDLTNVDILEGVFPDDTGHLIADRRFGFVHIDIDVYEGTRDVLQWVWSRLLPGGVVVIDDYGFPAHPGIAKAVDEMRAGSDRIFVYNISGQGMLVKLGSRVE